MADPTPETRDTILAALTDEWQSSRALHRKINLWAENTIAHKLRELAAIEAIERKDMPYLGGTIAMFRRYPSYANKT